MEQLDDASIGNFGRFRPAMRITAWNSGLWYARHALPLLLPLPLTLTLTLALTALSLSP